MPGEEGDGADGGEGAGAAARRKAAYRNAKEEVRGFDAAVYLPYISPISPYQVGASAQLLGAFCFNVSCVYGLPHMTTTHLQAAALTLTLTLTLSAHILHP